MPGDYINEARNLGRLRQRTESLAEHLAKVLDRDVAGYNRPFRDPENDNQRGWCLTVRNTINEIDDMDLSDKQLQRDLNDAGITSEIWQQIKTALRELLSNGFCDDHWGNFGGGSLAG